MAGSASMPFRPPARVEAAPRGPTVEAAVAAWGGSSSALKDLLHSPENST
jgi:hypothetical protein